MTSPSRVRTAAAWIPMIFLGVFFVWPVATIVAGHLDIATFKDVGGDESLHRVAWFTLWQAAASTAMALVIGLPLTWALTRFRFPGSAVLHGAASVPFLMPTVVVATGVAAILPDRGVVAIIWAHVTFNVAVVLRVVGTRWALLDVSVEEAGASLGANPWRVFRLVTWPSIREAVRNAAALVFAFCFSSFAVVIVLGDPGTRTLETEVFARAVSLGDLDSATALALLQTMVVLAILWFGRGSVPDVATIRWVTVPTQIRGWRNLLPVVVAVACTTVVVAPLAAVVVRSFRYAGEWTLVGWRALWDGTLDRVGLDIGDVVADTTRFAVAAVAITVPLAWLACRSGRVSWPERLSFAPLLVSSVTLGLGIIVTFDSSPVSWRREQWLIPVVHAVVAFPLAVRVIGPVVRSVGDDLMDAADDLGASAMRRWWSIEVPIVRRGVLRAAGISAAVSIGEFGATSFLSRSGSKTVPIAITELMGRPGPLLQQAGFALAALMVVAFTVVLARI